MNIKVQPACKCSTARAPPQPGARSRGGLKTQLTYMCSTTYVSVSLGMGGYPPESLTRLTVIHNQWAAAAKKMHLVRRKAHLLQDLCDHNDGKEGLVSHSTVPGNRSAHT